MLKSGSAVFSVRRGLALVSSLCIVLLAGQTFAHGQKPTTDADDVKKAEEPKEIRRKPVNLVVTKEVGRTQGVLDAYAKIIRQEQGAEVFEPNPQCPSADAPRYRKNWLLRGSPWSILGKQFSVV